MSKFGKINKTICQENINLAVIPKFFKNQRPPAEVARPLPGAILIPLALLVVADCESKPSRNSDDNEIG